MIELIIRNQSKSSLVFLIYTVDCSRTLTLLFIGSFYKLQNQKRKEREREREQKSEFSIDIVIGLLGFLFL